MKGKGGKGERKGKEGREGEREGKERGYAPTSVDLCRYGVVGR